jgi:DNA adenine methylase
MIKVNGYAHYHGGKSGNGTYQQIINLIPPHDTFYSLCLGNCGVTRHIKPARRNVLNDIDPLVCNAWLASDLGGAIYQVFNEPVLKFLQDLHSNYQISPENYLGVHFIYLDPPYKKDTRKSNRDVYTFEMSDEDHTDLLKQITTMTDFKIMISAYPNPLYDMWLHGWHTHGFLSQTRNGMAWERLYMNYKLTDGFVLHDYSYIGGNFTKRQTLMRRKNNFLKKLETLPAALKESVLQDILKKYST